MKAYSPDLRQRVLNAVEAGMPRREVVEQFQVSLSTIKRLLKQQREQGHVQPTAIPGPRFRIATEQHEALASQVRAQPDATLEQHCQQWYDQHKTRLSASTMSRSIRRLGWTHKKRA
jgi:transposase